MILYKYQINKYFKWILLKGTSICHSLKFQAYIKFIIQWHKHQNDKIQEPCPRCEMDINCIIFLNLYSTAHSGGHAVSLPVQTPTAEMRRYFCQTEQKLWESKNFHPHSVRMMRPGWTCSDGRRMNRISELIGEIRMNRLSSLSKTHESNTTCP